MIPLGKSLAHHHVDKAWLVGKHSVVSAAADILQRGFPQKSFVVFEHSFTKSFFGKFFLKLFTNSVASASETPTAVTGESCSGTPLSENSASVNFTEASHSAEDSEMYLRIRDDRFLCASPSQDLGTVLRCNAAAICPTRIYRLLDWRFPNNRARTETLTKANRYSSSSGCSSRQEMPPHPRTPRRKGMKRKENIQETAFIAPKSNRKPCHKPFFPLKGNIYKNPDGPSIQGDFPGVYTLVHRNFSYNRRMDSIKTIVIAGGTHGNELTGIELYEKWNADSKCYADRCPSAKIALVHTNIEATAACRRYIDKDLNRSFANSLLSLKSPEAYEIRRAQELNGSVRSQRP